MKTIKAVEWAFWLAAVAAFGVAGLLLAAGSDLPVIILGLGGFGLAAALLPRVVGAVLARRALSEPQAEVTPRLEETLLERVATGDRLRFDDLAQELGVSGAQVAAAVYTVTRKRLFTGYVDWRGRELVCREAAQLAGDGCPRCGATVEQSGKGVARCARCGTETYLPRPSTWLERAAARVFGQ